MEDAPRAPNDQGRRHWLRETGAAMVRDRARTQGRVRRHQVQQAVLGQVRQAHRADQRVRPAGHPAAGRAAELDSQGQQRAPGAARQFRRLRRLRLCGGEQAEGKGGALLPDLERAE